MRFQVKAWSVAATLLIFAFPARILLARRANLEADSTRQYSIQFKGILRTYLVHVPPTYAKTMPLPLVLVLHGATQSPESAERMSGMSLKADEENFITVYPRGTGSLPTWNSGNCCGYALRNQIDDIGFLRALIAKLERDYAIDSKRIFVTGISNGAMMSYRAACEMADVIAAVAPVEGALNISCRPTAPISVVVFNGTADRLVPYDGASSRYHVAGTRVDASTKDSVAFWIKHDGCNPTSQNKKTEPLITDVYESCEKGTSVTLYTIEGGRHSWPGISFSGSSVPATELIWSFFAAHPKK
jgi:polyhydroxybutyrate depolymerase